MGKKAFEIVKTDLEIQEHLDAHKTGFIVQKFGIVFIIGLVVAAALGVFGDGILSKRSDAKGDILLEYERFYRHEARMELSFVMVNVANDAEISFPNQYLKDVRVESIIPEPNSTRIDRDKVHYSFEGKGNMRITFYMVPRKVGTLNGSIDMNGHSFSLSHFIFP